MCVVSVMDTIKNNVVSVPMEERLCVEVQAVMIINFAYQCIDIYDEIVSSLNRKGSCTYVPKKLDLDLNNRAILPA